MKQLNLLKDSPKTLFFKYLVPSISATLVTSIYILADSIMIGKGIGPNGIAALNIVIPLFTIFFGIGLLFGVGGSVLMSVANGSGHVKEGRRYFTTSVYCTAVLSIGILVLIQAFLEPILYMLGATSVTFDYAKEYARVFVCGAPFFMFNSMLQAFIRSDKNPNLSMIAVISGGITNIVLDYIFIYIFSWGMAGGAIATVCGSIVTVTLLLTHFFKSENHLKLIAKGFSISCLRHTVGNGFASFLVEVSGGVITILFNIQLVRYLGDLGVTVYGIICNSSFIVLSLANGVAQAAQPIIATNYGAGKTSRVHNIYRLGIRTAWIIGIILSCICFFNPKLITAMFVDATDRIYEIAVPAIRIYSVAFLMTGVNIFISSYFQSIMMAQYALLIHVLRGLVLSTLFVCVLPLFFGATGIWIAIPLTEVIIYCLGRILKQKYGKGVLNELGTDCKEAVQ